jgi:mannosylglucosylglycerate synthase
MKIALIHYSVPPVVGGVETVLARQAEQLLHAGHTVLVLAGRGETWNRGIPVTLLPLIDSRHPLVMLVKSGLDAGQIPEEFPGLVEEIENDLRRELAGVDVVIAHNVASLHKNLALTTALYNLSQAPGAPRIVLWHHDLAWTADRYLKELYHGFPWDLLRIAWPGVRQVVVSDARQTELADLYEISLDEISVVPAGLDLVEFLALPPSLAELVKRLGLLQAAPILLTPVRITRRKNLEMAIGMLSVLRHDLPNAALVITGPPGAHNATNLEYMNELVELRERLGMKDYVHLMAEYAPGGLLPAEVAALFRLADALFLPSFEEGFGIPILEAALSHLPIFCSELPSLRALAGSTAPTYFSPNDPPEVVADVVRDCILSNPTYLLRTRVRLNYTWEAVYEKKIAPLLED